ncbi:MAG: SPOR domain-containing protein [Candidatus Omnitrophica bacterium]|nr:SPOR domain-containing protein [Candidatus Omnitrophota bacterium]
MRYFLILCVGVWWGISAHDNCFASNQERLKKYFLAGEYTQAIREGERLLAEDPSSASSDDLYYLLGLSYLKDRDYLRASDIFEIILNEFKGSRLRDVATLGLADTYFLQGNMFSAKKYYQELLLGAAKENCGAQAYYRLSQIAFKEGNTLQAQEYLALLKNEFPLNLESKGEEEICVLSESGVTLCYSVQVGSFSNEKNAQNLLRKLKKDNYLAYIEVTTKGGRPFHQVRIGKFQTRPEAVTFERKLAQEGYPTRIYP